MERQNEKKKEDEELTNEQVEEIFNRLEENYGISGLLDDEGIDGIKQKIREVRGNLEILKKYIEDEIC